LYEVEDSRLHFGPTLTTQTSKGLPLDLHSLWVQPKPGEEVKGRKGTPLAKTFLVLATDEDTKVIGFRSAQIGAVNEDLRVKSDIATGLRGEGISTRLDLALLFLLRVEAAKRGKEIVWAIENGNLRTLEMQKFADSTPNIKEYEAEQKRWKALYGAEGKLGFNHNGTLIIEPHRDYGAYDLEGLDGGKLSHWGNMVGDREIIVPWLLDLTRDNKDAIRQKKLAEFRTRLEPAILSTISGR
jgi:hypothetical protein